jgi:hypothetical protein
MAVAGTTYFRLHHSADAFDVFEVVSANVVFAMVKSRSPNGPGADATRSEELRAHCDLLRDIFGGAFRSAGHHRDWQTQDVAQLARHIYEESAFEFLPMLGDALEKAGYTDGEVLSHCREPGQHVKGCWVIDLLLGQG